MEYAQKPLLIHNVSSAAVTAPWFVDFRDVWLAYNDELLKANNFAVEAIDPKIHAGVFIAIVGPSGAANRPS